MSSAYDFWENVLKSPKLIVAPMVDMSELSFRSLCRRYDAHLCFSPMIHAARYLRDFTYRQQIFSTCPEDRPLIIQLCANEAETFLKAAELLQTDCDAIDLNLGCPQAIAKRGNYGAFLQDDWDRITDIVKTASENLNIPVTCKIRIHSDLQRTIRYARMIESAGAQVLTIHGRTRDQKQHLTGKADWDVIKAVKQAVGIPVIANGNILDFNDIEDCLRYTGADAVMSAEAILHNPALFSGKNPNVCEMAEEFLNLCYVHSTDIGHVRTHLFWLFAYSLPSFPDLQMQLGMANTMDKLKDVVNKLKQCLLLMKETYSSSDSDRYTLEPWICHSRPRVKNKCDGTTVRCNIQGRDVSETKTAVEHSNIGADCEENDLNLMHLWSDSDGDSEESENNTLSKGEKKQLRSEQKIAGKKIRRKKQLMNRRQKIREERLQLREVGEAESEHISKYDKRQITNERLKEALKTGLRVCIDLSLEDTMSKKVKNRLAQQLCRLYGYNRQSENPLSLHFTGFDKCGILYKECQRKNDGFEQYIVNMHEELHGDIFDPADIVYLSPDSENVLEDLDISKVYMIGGLVDESVTKNITQSRANSSHIQTARLPIDEYMVKADVGTYSQILAPNQVFQILLTYYATRSWPKAFQTGIPARKGFIVDEAYKL
ncbi:tRNA-dihydrouridine(16/17) synthase [NAD(P)(+)]-like isoform X2 [Tubulanus polymorphus]|uniref:tRNA-dihydrouridine(16/17) synthase [NAD(P)(+)]-like isoform X2 n=1 Tax=Tubulanus polymorphus TaxID=672921 RepID=UPI003DA49EB5